MTDEKLKKDVVATIAEQLGVDIDDVTEEKSFIEDLNADSLDLTEMIMTLEEKFNVEIADEQAEKLKTVADVIRFINEKKGS
jgi:acyl carrier protein